MTMTTDNKAKLYTGILSKNVKGFGFVTCDEMDVDIFIPGRDMRDAMDGDTVEVRLVPEYLWKNSPQGEIVTVTRRALTQVAGRFERSGNYGFLIPDGKK